MEVGLQTFQGSAFPTVEPITDASGFLRNFQMGENGILQAPLVVGGDPSSGVPLFMNDTNNLTSWQITINWAGAITPVLLPAFVDSYPQTISFVSTLGDQYWNLQLSDMGGGNAILQTTPFGIIGRGPEITLRWSNDGAKTFTDPGRILDCGQAGQTLTRVIARQLGSARDRVYEMSMTDPAPWRIIDAYLFTDPEDRAPTSRYSS